VTARHAKLTCDGQTAEVGIQTPENIGCESSSADNSQRFLPTDGQTGMYGSPFHRKRCTSHKSTFIARGSPQCHDFRCNRDTAWVWKFAHLVHILVAAGIDSRVQLMRIFTQHCVHNGAD